MSTLDTLTPTLLWRYFRGLSAIPRASKQEAAVGAWLLAQGRELGLEVEQDAVGNVLIRKPGSPGYEGAPAVAIQGHMDMVCEKNAGTVHDFSRDPIVLRRDGDLVSATGTTLGADNGIGVAAGLAALAEPGLVHPPLELLVTVDEETGLTGAQALAPGWLRARTLLNLDSGEEGHVTVGCAGGVDTIATRAVTWEPAPAGHVGLHIAVAGLKGGHSGGDIHLGRGNAIRVLARVLAGVGVPTRIASIEGGNKRNAIPREASAVVCVAPSDVAALEAAVARLAEEVRTELGSFDPGVTVTVSAAEVTRVAAEGDTLVRLLLALPHGVEAMSPAIPGLVLTSTNLGVVHTTDVFEVNLLTRSAIEASKFALTERIAAVCTLAGFATELVGNYSGWKPEPGAQVVRTIDAAWQALSGAPIQVDAIHAGLECGLIGETYPGMEMASFGPNMWDCHTPDERVSVASVERFWGLLVAVLERLAKRTA